ncbi:putative MscS family protein YkuT [Planctomycetes bacterium Poly30]|uniref:Putative MscS family protein YkuT n=1 Tax=Saltatorellus ferox TaxID=2528018 RepID=A0A518EL85_9BACT|nr:putative MscS family protein YkuT [Planctomycetes bacterium Poly30]
MDWIRSQTLPTQNAVLLGIALLAVLVVFAGLRLVLLGGIARSLGGKDRPASVRATAQVLAQNLRLLLLFAQIVLLLAIGAGAALVWVRGTNLIEWGKARLASLPEGFWQDFGIALGRVAVAAIGLAILLRGVRRALAWATARAKAWEGLRANDESIEGFFALLATLIRLGAWLAFFVWAAADLGLVESWVTALGVALRIFIIVALGVLAWRAIDAVVVSLDALSRKYSSPNNLLRFYDRLQHLVPALRRTLEWALWILVGTQALRQIDAYSSAASTWGPRFVRVVGILFLARVAVEVSKIVVQQSLLRDSKLSREARQRRSTILPLIESVIQYIVYFGAAIMVLEALGQDPTPFLAGAGIVGLAVGLGAQNLVNDMVCGFFILFEDHYLVGDFVRIGDAEGVVERVDLRTTRIRDQSGRHHILRNGSIEAVVNFSKEYVYAVVDVGVAYESDLDVVVSALEEAAERLRARSTDVLEPTSVKGLDVFGESELTYRTVTKVRPGAHLSVARLLRRIIKDVFDERGVEIPYARRVLILKNETVVPFPEQAAEEPDSEESPRCHGIASQVTSLFIEEILAEEAPRVHRRGRAPSRPG